MSASIPNRNHGWPLVAAVFLIGGGMFAKGLPQADRFFEKFVEFRQEGLFAFALLLIASWAYHGNDKSPAGKRPIGSLVVLASIVGLVVAASTAAIMDPAKGHYGAAQQWATGSWLLIACIGVSYLHARFGHKGRPSAPRMPSFRRKPASPTFLQLPGMGGGH